MGRKNRQQSFNQCTIVDTAAKGKSVAKTAEGIPIFLNEGVPGDIVDITTFRKRKGYYEGKITHYHHYSEDRTDAVCTHFGLCGGCKWQHMQYTAQLKFKEKEVSENLVRLGKVTPEKTLPIMACTQPYFYRNKMEFSFSSNRWLTQAEIEKNDTIDKTALGFHKPGMWDKIIDIEKCHLQADPSNELRNAIKAFARENALPFYHPKLQTGQLRTLTIRTSSTGQIMVLLQASYTDDAFWQLMEYIKTNFPSVTSLLYVVNTKVNNTLYDQEVLCYAGEDHIVEKMENLHFKIGAKTFYQTNSGQAHLLYQCAREFAQLKPDDIVYDLYTGIGTIAQFMAGKAKKVIGVDVVPDSIKAASENAQANKIDNVAFEVGDMKDVFNQAFIERHGKADVVVTDPPREGMHKKVVEQLIQLRPKRIVYVSCNSATQARDLQLLAPYYKVVTSRAVDMFPQTHHVENVVLLEQHSS